MDPLTPRPWEMLVTCPGPGGPMVLMGRDVPPPSSPTQLGQWVMVPCPHGVAVEVEMMLRGMFQTMATACRWSA